MSHISLKSQLRILKKDSASRTEQELSALVDAFQDTKFFQQLDDKAMREVCKAIVAERHHAGDTVFEEGDRGDKFYIVLAGKVDVIVRVEQQEEHAQVKRTTAIETALRDLMVPKELTRQQSVEVTDVQTLKQRCATGIRKKLLRSSKVSHTQDSGAAKPIDAAEERRRHERRLVNLLGVDEAQLRTADWMDMFKGSEEVSDADQHKPLLSPRGTAEQSYDLPHDISLTSDAGIAIFAMEKQAGETSAPGGASTSSLLEEGKQIKLAELPKATRQVSFFSFVREGLDDACQDAKNETSGKSEGDDVSPDDKTVISGQADGNEVEEVSDTDSDSDSATSSAPLSPKTFAEQRLARRDSQSAISSQQASSNHRGSRKDSFCSTRTSRNSVHHKMKVLHSKVASLGAGASFGETALEGGVPRSASIKCEEACWLAVLHRDDYTRIMTRIVEEKRAEHLKYTERCPLLSGLALQDRSQLAAMFREISATQNTVVCKIHQAAAEVYFVAEGEFAVNTSTGASSASRLPGSGNFREVIPSVTAALLSAPQVHGLGTCLRGEQYHQEALVCRSTKGKVYSLLAKHLLSALPKERREILMVGTLAQRQFRQNRAAVLRQMNSQERLPKDPESPTKKARGIYFPEGRLQAIRAGVEKCKKEQVSEEALVDDCWNPASCQPTTADEEKRDEGDKVPPMEPSPSCSRRLHPELLGVWLPDMLHVRARLQRAASEGLLHRMPPPLEVNPFRVNFAHEQEPERFALAMTSSASEPVLTEEKEAKSEPEEEITSLSRSGSPIDDVVDGVSSSPNAKYRDDSLARKLDLELAEMDAAAARIQASWRGLVQRSALYQIRRYARKMQALIRGFLARRQARRMAEVKAQRRAEEERAVIRIESLFRGWAARRRFASLVKEKQEEKQQSRTSSLSSRRTRLSSARLVTLDMDGPNLGVLKKVLCWRERHRKLPLPPTEPAANSAAILGAARPRFMLSASKTCSVLPFPLQEKLPSRESDMEAESFSRRLTTLPELTGFGRRMTNHRRFTPGLVPHPPQHRRTFAGFHRRRTYKEAEPFDDQTVEEDDDEDEEGDGDDTPHTSSGRMEVATPRGTGEQGGTAQSFVPLTEDKLKLPLLGNGKAALFASVMGESGALSPWRAAAGGISSLVKHPDSAVDLSTVYTWSRR
eukprot:TRINITY_DN32845_c0_g1_i1.p1 TRINITY_DN32845_c0_g1~~TRINITY_DN32845_c0_g1_i1.p1  ORF type:complete len:1168 (+),score=235.58 TRINITY_DN32845_c0_g1_i1:173-3676(+)